jgi:hypothetical protein
MIEAEGVKFGYCRLAEMPGRTTRPFVEAEKRRCSNISGVRMQGNNCDDSI